MGRPRLPPRQGRLKQRRPALGDGRRPDSGAAEQKPDLAPDHAIAQETSVSARAGALDGVEVGPRSPTELADRVGLALRVPPRDAAWSERLSGLVAASHLPTERRTALAERLAADQALADDVAHAVRSWMGADSEAARSDLVRAFDGAAAALASAATGPEPELVVADAVAERLGASPEAVAGLCRQLGVLLALLWDEEEEEHGTPGDYAAEESGA